MTQELDDENVIECQAVVLKPIQPLSDSDSDDDAEREKREREKRKRERDNRERKNREKERKSAALRRWAANKNCGDEHPCTYLVEQTLCNIPYVLCVYYPVVKYLENPTISKYASVPIYRKLYLIIFL